MSAGDRSKRAIFRTDASPEIGAGHVMRCLTLADTLAKQGWRCDFASAPGTADTVALLAGGQHQVKEQDDFANPAAMIDTWPDGCDLLVVDHYRLDKKFEAPCRPWAKQILVIDDLADRDHECDFLLDQTLGCVPAQYRELVPAACTLLLGPSYALLRPQFAQARKDALQRRQQGTEIERILLSLGATDPRNLVGDALQALAQTGTRAAIDVVIGSAAPHLKELRKVAASGDLNVTLHVDQADMASVMAKADLAIGAGGTSSWERCCLGLPTLLVIAADNQRQVAASLTQVGAVRIIGENGDIEATALTQEFDALTNNATLRKDMGLSAATVCDGLGQNRVCGFLDPLLAKDGQSVVLRPARMEDSDIIYGWQSDPETRRYFRTPQAPQAEEHRAWMTAKLAAPDCLFNVIIYDGKRAGVVRLDRLENGDFEISILVDPACHGAGIGRAAIKAATRLIPEGRFMAEAHADNAASQALFKSAGFSQRENLFFYENDCFEGE